MRPSSSMHLNNLTMQRLSARHVGLDVCRSRFRCNLIGIDPMNVSEFVWQRLSEWGLKRVYGYPGDGVGGLDVALEKAKDRMQYVQVRHEEMAAFMASAHAKFTGQVGLCYATSGPGAIHLLNGLYDAKLDHVPVVALRDAILTHASWPASAHGPGRLLSAGGRPAESFQGCCQRIRRNGQRPRAGASFDRPRG